MRTASDNFASASIFLVFALAWNSTSGQTARADLTEAHPSAPRMLTETSAFVAVIASIEASMIINFQRLRRAAFQIPDEKERLPFLRAVPDGDGSRGSREGPVRDGRSIGSRVGNVGLLWGYVVVDHPTASARA